MPESLPYRDEKCAAHQRRLTWAVRVAGAALKTALERDTSEQAVRLRETAAEDLALALGQMIMDEADPTANKRFTPWLMREYAAGRLILEDLGSANDTLTLFQRYARRLKPEDRDIQRYRSLADAWKAVREFAEREEAHSNRAQKALERAQAYAESRILRQDPDGFTVAVPLTEFAAKWWGRGTRWCTAAEKNNAFWQYHKKAPLLVMVIPGHGKFQMWMTTTECHFMDAGDEPVAAALSRSIWPWVGTLLLAALEQNGNVLKFIPAEHQTYDLCLAAVQQYGWTLDWAPEEYRTLDLCITAVRQCGEALYWVPQEHRTYEICLAAVQKDGTALEFVPEEYRTQDLRLAAVQENGWAFVWVPEEHMTHDLCLAAVQQYGRALQWVSREHRVYDLCLAAVRQNGCALENVPQEHRTYDLCLVAARQNGGALQYVPQNHRTHELCLAAVQQNGLVLQWVPEEHRSYDLYLAAVRQNGRALAWVPKERRTYDICIAAVRQDGRALEWVPKEHRTPPEMTLLTKRPLAQEPTISWDLDHLATWCETLKTTPRSLMVRHA